MFYLIYISSATKLLEDADLYALLNKCRENNKRHEITGMMLYKSGNFMQMLEGEEGDILSLFEKIKVDHRHENIIEILSGDAKQRSFSSWSMGFYNMDKEQDLPGFDRYIELSLSPDKFQEDKNEAYHFISRFNERNR
jgi:Sensors of blue-light using FAD